MSEAGPVTATKESDAQTTEPSTPPVKERAQAASTVREQATTATPAKEPAPPAAPARERPAASQGKPEVQPSGVGPGTTGPTLANQATAGATGAQAQEESPAVVSEFMEELSDPKHPLGPFKDPHSTMIAGIEEHVGYVPGWLLGLLILAVLLAMVMWIPTSY